ncbi:hypothetical protein [Alteromonas facilis]|uniref:hypothetical protein n=1 Tax=Alteromonas facilis TaxID=2048004 RepID=UPI000F5C9EBA|nr:hypothetical protein [Alteromonas facilis]
MAINVFIGERESTQYTEMNIASLQDDLVTFFPSVTNTRVSSVEEIIRRYEQNLAGTGDSEPELVSEVLENGNFTQLVLDGQQIRLLGVFISDRAEKTNKILLSTKGKSGNVILVSLSDNDEYQGYKINIIDTTNVSLTKKSDNVGSDSNSEVETLTLTMYKSRK